MRSAEITGARRNGSATATIALILLLVGCGDGDGPSSAGASSQNATADALTSAPDEATSPATVTAIATGGTGATGTGAAGTPGGPGATGGGTPVVKTGGAKTATGTATAAATETLDRVQLPGGPGYVTFQSPSGNIQCAVGDAAAQCLALEAAWSVPDPGDCELDWAGAEVAVSAEGSFAGACRGDTFLVPSPPVLQYGQEYVQGDIRCVSREDGVTCEYLPSGVGFRIARESYQVF